MELYSKTLSSIASDIKEKKVTIKEVLDSVYKRIEEVEPKVGALRICAERLHRTLAGTLEHRLAADRAVLIRRHIPRHKTAGCTALTSVISVAALTFAFQNRAATLRTAARHLFRNGLGELTLRVAGAGKEFTEAARLYDEIPTADLTFFV